MDSDRNLLLGILAIKTGLIERSQLVDACSVWSMRENAELADILIERGWILDADKVHLEYLIERSLQKHDHDPKQSIAALDNAVKRLIASLNDPDIARSLATLPYPDGHNSTAQIDLVSLQRERYALTRLHAAGGIGQVWVAQDTEVGREIALKELRPEQAQNPLLWQRFVMEARITGQLEHPGIVPVYELGRDPTTQQPFYTMRLVKGRTLSAAARAYHDERQGGEAHPLQFLALLTAFAAVCNTIAYAHSRGVIHRDLKGQNVILGDFGEVVVLDWGLAKRICQNDEAAGSSSVPDGLEQNASADFVTVQGDTVGTPAYMAPEQAAGLVDMVDYRTDVYGLGAVLYEILTGCPPFTGPDTREVLRRVRQEEPIAPRQIWPDVPSTLEGICLRAMSKRPENRFASPAEIAQKVQGWQEAQRRHAEEEMERFFNLSLDMLCIAGFDGRFRRLNAAWEKTLGFEKSELLSKPYLEFIHPDDHDRTLVEATNIAQGENCISFENRYRCKDGSYKWLLWVANGFPEQGLIYAAALDITERKKVESALCESEERYRMVISAMHDGIVLFDAAGNICACNNSAEHILGLSADQMLERTSRDPRWRAIHEDGSTFPTEEFPAVITLQTGQPCFDVLMGVHKPGGDLTWISINSQPLYQADGKTVSGVVVSFSDMTDRKQMQDELKRMAGGEWTKATSQTGM